MLLVPVAGTALLRLLADLSASLEDQGKLAAAASCQALTGRGLAVAYNLETAGGAIGAPAKRRAGPCGPCGLLARSSALSAWLAALSGVSPAYPLLAWFLALPAAVWASWALGERAGVEVSWSRAAICSLVSLSAGLARPSSESLFPIILLPATVKRG